MISTFLFKDIQRDLLPPLTGRVVFSILSLCYGDIGQSDQVRFDDKFNTLKSVTVSTYVTSIRVSPVESRIMSTAVRIDTIAPRWCKQLLRQLSEPSGFSSGLFLTTCSAAMFACLSCVFVGTVCVASPPMWAWVHRGCPCPVCPPIPGRTPTVSWFFVAADCASSEVESTLFLCALMDEVGFSVTDVREKKGGREGRGEGGGSGEGGAVPQENKNESEKQMKKKKENTSSYEHPKCKYK